MGEGGLDFFHFSLDLLFLGGNFPLHALEFKLHRATLTSLLGEFVFLSVQGLLTLFELLLSLLECGAECLLQVSVPLLVNLVKVDVDKLL